MNKLTLFAMLGLGALALGLVALGLLGREALAQQTQAQPGPGAFGAWMSSDHFALNWNVAAAGGGVISSDHFRIASTLGQPVIGNSGSANFEHHAGYWQTWVYRIFLPLVLKNQ